MRAFNATLGDHVTLLRSQQMRSEVEEKAKTVEGLEGNEKD
jgi:hypothetical protein